jgi:hypothetical protein
VIGRLADVVKALIAQTDRLSAAVAPGAQTVTASGLGTVSLTGDTGGLFVKYQNPFDDPLRLRIRGKVQIGSLVANPPQPSALRVAITFLLVDNPALSGKVEQSMPVEPDGTWEVVADLFFDAAISRPHTVTGSATVEGTTAAVEPQKLKVEDARLEWFLEGFDRAEPAAAMADRRDFLAAVRKVLQPSEVFNKAIGRAARVRPLLATGTEAAKRWKAAETVWFEGEDLRLGHVIIGIEGGKAQDPQPSIPAFGPHVGDIVTWAGDLGSPIQEYLYQYYFPLMFGQSPDYPNFSSYIAPLVSRDQLVADIDGINLAARYDRTRTLADNLRQYYGHDSRTRFSTYLRTQRSPDDKVALATTVGPTGPKLTAAARTWIAERIAFAARALLSAVILFHAPVPKVSKADPWPAAVEAALDPTSPEVTMMTDRFVDFLEKGLAAEPP